MEELTLRANHLVAHDLQHLHDFCLVRTSEISQRSAVESHRGELGNRLLRIALDRMNSRRRSSKPIQEVITLTVFAVFSVSYLGEKLKWNYAAGFACIVLAVFFVFHKW